jgi:uncharacterized membrane protein (UPF0127 family)
MKAINCRNERVFLDDLREAKGFWRAFAGLMLRRALPPSEGLLFRPGRSVHTHFMRFPIDLVLLDEQGRVQAIREAMPPWRFDLRSAAALIEANAGAARTADLHVGDRLRFDP